MMTTNEIRRRQERWRRFLSPSAKPGFLFLINWPSQANSLPPAPAARREFIKERIEYKWHEYQHALWRASQADDDRVPCLNMMTATSFWRRAPATWKKPSASRRKCGRFLDTMRPEVAEYCNQIKSLQGSMSQQRQGIWWKFTRELLCLPEGKIIVAQVALSFLSTR